MRRLQRWTFNTVAAASLLLCLAAAGLWVRSYSVCDQFVAERQEASEYGRHFGIPHYSFGALSDRGQLFGWFGWSERPELDTTPSWSFKLYHPGRPGSWFDRGFSTRRLDFEGYAFNTQNWGVHDWMLVSTSALLPSIVVLRQIRAVRRRRRRVRLGCCPACGYDLRATPGRCPECGVEQRGGVGEGESGRQAMPRADGAPRS